MGDSDNFQTRTCLTVHGNLGSQGNTTGNVEFKVLQGVKTGKENAKTARLPEEDQASSGTFAKISKFFMVRCS